MTKLIVSVRNAAEAAIAERAGADLIDVKEPLRGALGAADVDTIEAIARFIDGRVPISAALGELNAVTALPPTLSGRIDYAKIGLSATQSSRDWLARWRNAVLTLPEGIAPVAVAYADWETAAAPSPETVLRHAAVLGCRAALLDTFDKNRGCLFDHLAVQGVAEFVATTRRLGLTCVLAGGLRFDGITQAIGLGPDYVAVRGAVCERERTGMLDAARVAQLAAFLRAAPTICLTKWRSAQYS